MGYWALLLSVLLYLVVAVDLAIKKKFAMSIIFLAYTVANIAYVYLAYREKAE
tara:strand:+ start:187 stop:345 length:159 start_codon:yes stop_codon:yes gene_type:complete